MRVWLNTFPRIAETATIAREAEQAGLFGVLLTDSQCLAPDTFVELGYIARATTQLHFGVCATNVVTRHPTVVANLAATLQAESGGRMHLGIARGDSAVLKVGLEPLNTAQFGQALADVRRLLAGEPAEIAGTTSTLQWRDPDQVTTPVLAVASGPRMIREAAHNADGLILQVGSDPEAIRQYIAQIREVAPEPTFRVASYVIVGLPDGQGTTGSIRGVTPLLARMATESLQAVHSKLADATQAATKGYSLATHGLSKAIGADQTDDLGYAVTGTVEECRDRLIEIAQTGCDELVIIVGSLDTPTPELLTFIKTFGDEIAPHLREL